MVPGRTWGPRSTRCVLYAFSPDSRSVIFKEQAPAGLDFDIVMAATDGSASPTLVGGPTNDEGVAVSPSGAIAFLRTSGTSADMSGGPRAADIYVTAADGSEPRKIGIGVGDYGGMAWSPDETKIATVNLAGDQIVVTPVDGSAPTLIPAPGSLGILTWQPES